MENLISRIIQGDNLEEVYDYVRSNIFTKGPVDISDLEILSYLCEYDSIRFESKIDYILNDMALFYKQTGNINIDSVEDLMLADMKDFIVEKFSQPFTPVQADIVDAVHDLDCYSFSAPTSTGKSFVLMDLIIKCPTDVVVVVPSRALINEYYIKLRESVQDKTVNILTFIDRINTAHSRKNIFVVTPERCRELFSHKDEFNVGLFLFDEAQLSDESSIRGLLFDSIVRRCHKHFPKAKLIFAHPFIENPEAQIEKNHLDDGMRLNSYPYRQRNVGQMFFYADKDWNYYHCGLNQKVMGYKKVDCPDPIQRILSQEKGSVMFYVSKSSILSGSCLTDFERYVNMCQPFNNAEVDEIIKKLEEYTGGNTRERRFYYSEFIDLLKRGIVLHHGSLPMKSRLLIEDYIKRGFCRICFATATLEQGVNMPFEAVYIERFSKKDYLAIKNIIGRAGRSSKEKKFDYGYVILKSANNMNDLRKILNTGDYLKDKSSLDESDELDADYKDFKDAVNNGSINDDYNLTPNELTRITTEDVYAALDEIKGFLIYNGRLADKLLITNRGFAYKAIADAFVRIYVNYLQRDLAQAEEYVLREAIDIMLFKIFGNTFKKICWMRYNRASRLIDRRKYAKEGIPFEMLARFTVGYKEIPDRYMRNYPLFPQNTKAEDVSYDLIIYDTYDYLDKLVNFRLADIFYAAANEYYGLTHDEDVKKLSLLVRFGTFNEKHIWMLRYGLSFEDIETLDHCIDSIDEKGIVFNDTISGIDEEIRFVIERYIN